MPPSHSPASTPPFYLILIYLLWRTYYRELIDLKKKLYQSISCSPKDKETLVFTYMLGHVLIFAALGRSSEAPLAIVTVLPGSIAKPDRSVSFKPVSYFILKNFLGGSMQSDVISEFCCLLDCLLSWVFLDLFLFRSAEHQSNATIKHSAQIRNFAIPCEQKEETKMNLK